MAAQVRVEDLAVEAGVRIQDLEDLLLEGAAVGRLSSGQHGAERDVEDLAARFVLQVPPLQIVVLDIPTRVNSPSVCAAISNEGCVVARRAAVSTSLSVQLSLLSRRRRSRGKKPCLTGWAHIVGSRNLGVCFHSPDLLLRIAFEDHRPSTSLT